jgi:hypothetical protein
MYATVRLGGEVNNTLFPVRGSSVLRQNPMVIHITDQPRKNEEIGGEDCKTLGVAFR